MVDIADRSQRASSGGLAGLLYNQVVRGVLVQVLVAGLVVLGFWYFASNAAENMARAGLVYGFGFLERPANFPIGEAMIEYSPADTYGRAIMVGLLNTLKVALVGCVLCTVLGVFLGIMRLSPNPLLNGLVQAYIEIVRNTPLLLQLIFWAFITRGVFPGPRQALEPLPGVFLSNRGVKLPWIEYDPAQWYLFGAVVIGIVVTIIYRAHVKKVQEATGQIRPVWPVLLTAVVAVPALVVLALGVPLRPDMPVLRGFNFVGGITLTPELAALLIGLVMYTSAFVAEIVRAGIQSVSKGQWEAARALGLSDGRIMRMIILPQALRVIVPPQISQYLNLTKNSSLAVAIGYPDLVAVVNTTMNQTGQSIETILLIMAAYLSVSLSISLFMNWFNTRIAIKER
ncbi:MAG: ABC transporter permease subunit [Alphaproteobacteria bacterium]|nr:ABC transporter permease subunit [Alphaproteobacteria bacterium]